MELKKKQSDNDVLNLKSLETDINQKENNFYKKLNVNVVYLGLLSLVFLIFIMTMVYSFAGKRLIDNQVVDLDVISKKDFANLKINEISTMDDLGDRDVIKAPWLIGSQGQEIKGVSVTSEEIIINGLFDFNRVNNGVALASRRDDKNRIIIDAQILYLKEDWLGLVWNENKLILKIDENTNFFDENGKRLDKKSKIEAGKNVLVYVMGNLEKAIVSEIIFL